MRKYTITELRSMSADAVLDLCQSNGVYVYNDDTKADMIDSLMEKQTLPNASECWWLNFGEGNDGVTILHK
jgi:hypothetical protein